MDNPIKTYLERKGMTQRSFAKAIGVREATLSAWANGAQPSSAMIQVMAKHGIPASAWFRKSNAA